MSNPIRDAELALVARLKEGFGNTLRQVDSLPDDWDDKTFETLLRMAPGAYVVFGGGQARDSQATDQAALKAGFSVVFVTRHASGEKARRHGDPTQIGAYEMIAIGVQLLHGHTIPGVGTLEFSHIDNLNEAAIDKQGGCVYAVGFVLPMALDAGGVDASSLDDFIRYYDTVDQAPIGDQDDAQDHVTLEQP